MAPASLNQNELRTNAVLTEAPFELTCIDVKDRPKHVGCIERLVEETERSMEEIAPLYAEVLEHMHGQARIRDYLPILVSKNVKNILYRSSSR